MNKPKETLKKLYASHKEIVDYLFWGVVAFILSMVLYWVFYSLFKWTPVISNTVDWIIVVVFAYITNKTFVFRSHVKGIKALFGEFVSFVAARLFTLLLEDAIIFVGVTLLGYNTNLGSMAVKLIGQVVVIITNYILSKLLVFRKPKKTKEAENTEMENK